MKFTQKKIHYHFFFFHFLAPDMLGGCVSFRITLMIIAYEPNFFVDMIPLMSCQVCNYDALMLLTNKFIFLLLITQLISMFSFSKLTSYSLNKFMHRWLPDKNSVLLSNFSTVAYIFVVFVYFLSFCKFCLFEYIR